jgi:hypothetical protein
MYKYKFYLNVLRLLWIELHNILNFLLQHFVSHTTLPCKVTFCEPSQYSVWLRAGRPGDRGSIPGKGEGFFL